MFRHAIIEKNVILLAILTLITVSIGGLVQIVPLFTIETTIERVEGVRPYSPLELAGPQHLCPRGLLRLPQPAGPAVQATRSSATATTAWPPRACTTTRSSGARSAPGPISRASAASTRTTGTSRTWSIRARWCRRSIMPPYPFLAERRLATATSPSICKRAAHRRRALQRRDDRQCRAPTSRRRRSRRRPDGAAAALPASAVVGNFDGSPDGHRDGCAGRLSADARHAGGVPRPAASKTSAAIGADAWTGLAHLRDAAQPLGRVVHGCSSSASSSGRSGRRATDAASRMLGRIPLRDDG